MFCLKLLTCQVIPTEGRQVDSSTQQNLGFSFCRFRVDEGTGNSPGGWFYGSCSSGIGSRKLGASHLPEERVACFVYTLRMPCLHLLLYPHVSSSAPWQSFCSPLPYWLLSSVYSLSKLCLKFPTSPLCLHNHSH